MRIATLLGARLLRGLLPAVPWRSIAALAVPTCLLVGTTLLLEAVSDNLWLVPAFGLVALGVFAVALFVVLRPIDRSRLASLWRGDA